MMATSRGPMTFIRRARRRAYTCSSGGVGFIGIVSMQDLRRLVAGGGLARMQLHEDQLRADANVFDQFGVSVLLDLLILVVGARRARELDEIVDHLLHFRRGRVEI